MLFLTLLVIPTILYSQEYAYRSLEGGNISPSGRVDGAIAYEPRGKRVFLFGGRDTAPRNDLWSYSLEARRWTELRPTGGAPGARFGHTLIYDAPRNRVIVFGGQGGGFFSDVWAYNIGENTWRQLAPDNAGPSKRYGHSAAVDGERDRMVISHGFTDDGRFDDTWAFDLARGTWRNISPPEGAPRPLRRCLHHAVLDAAGSEMLLYGGCSSGFGPCPQGDLWAFDLRSNRWTERTGVVRPPARQWYGTAFDPARRRLVLFGGSGENGSLNDTWEYDAAAGGWRRVNVASPPAARQRHEGTYVEDLRGVLYFGGSTDSGLSNELVLYAMLASPSQGPRLTAAGIVNAFSGVGGAISPGEIAALYGSGLGPDRGVTTAFGDEGALPRSAGGVNVLIGGIAAPIFHAQSGQVNVQVPYEIAGLREAEVVVHYGGAASEPVRVAVAAASPGLHPFTARVGDVVVLFITGAGAALPAIATGRAPEEGNLPQPAAEIRLQMAGADAEILFAGFIPQAAGVVQLNARIPAGVSGGSVPIVLTVGGVETAGTITIE